MLARPVWLVCSLLAAAVVGISSCGARSELASRSGATGAGGTSSSIATGAGGGNPTSTTTGNGGATPAICAWSERFGDSRAQFITGLGVGPKGEVLLAGVFRGALDFGDQTIDSENTNKDSGFYGGSLFLARLDPSGTAVWSRAFVPSAEISTVQLAVDHQGNSVLSMVTGQTIDFGGGKLGPGTLLAKLDPAGDLLWSQALAGDGATVKWADIAVDPQGSILLWTITELDFAQALQLIKLDSQGEHLWTKTFPVAGLSLFLQPSIGRTIVVNPQGEILVAIGAQTPAGPSDGGSLDFGGGPLSIPSEGRNAFVAKLDPQGNLVYSRLLTETSGVGDLGYMATSLAAGSAGEIFITCNFTAPVDAGNGLLPLPPGSPGSVLVARLDTSGATTWSRLVGDDMFSRAIAVTGTGDLVLSGGINGSLDLGGGGLLQNDSGSTETFVARLHGATGEHASSQLFGPGQVAMDFLSAHGQGDVIAAGRLHESVDFCGNTLLGAGHEDVVVVRLSP